MIRQTVWLIEVDPRPGCDSRYLHRGHGGSLFWSSSPDNAIHFDSEAEARSFAAEHTNGAVGFCAMPSLAIH